MHRIISFNITENLEGKRQIHRSKNEVSSVVEQDAYKLSEFQFQALNTTDLTEKKNQNNQI